MPERPPTDERAAGLAVLISEAVTHAVEPVEHRLEARISGVETRLSGEISTLRGEWTERQQAEALAQAREEGRAEARAEQAAAPISGVQPVPSPPPAKGDDDDGPLIPRSVQRVLIWIVTTALGALAVRYGLLSPEQARQLAPPPPTPAAPTPTETTP